MKLAEEILRGSSPAEVSEMGFHFALEKHIIEQRLLEEDYSEEESEAMQRAIKVLEGLLAICRRIAERRLERARQLLAQPQLTLPVVPAGDAAVSEESEVLRGARSPDMDWLGKTGEVLRSAIAHLEAEQEEGKEAAAAAEEEIELWLLSETEQSEVTALKKLREQISDPEEAVDQDNDTVLWLLSPAAYRNALISDIVAGRAPLSVDDLSNVERLDEEIAKLEALAEERPLSDMETWELGFLLDQLEFARLEERDRADAQGPAAPPIAPLPTIEVGAGDDQVQEAGGDPLELS